MPGHEIHVFIDQFFFGRSYRVLHKAIDFPVLFYGKGHRKYFHTPLEVTRFAIFLFPGDPAAVLAGRLHLLIDNLCSKDPDYEKFLETMAKQAQDNKRANERRNKMVQAIIEQMNQNNEFMIKMMEKNFKLVLDNKKDSKKTKKEIKKENKKWQQQLIMIKRILEK